MSESAHASRPSRFRLWHYALAAALAWTALIVASLAWSMFEQRRQILDNARHEAQVSFQQEMLLRFWMEGHRSDTPATNNAPPSSDLVRAKQRVLFDSVAMLRQIQGRSSGKDEHRSHLTSLKPLHPENAPDPWEAGVLQAFVQGETEVAAVATMDGQKYVRVMRPLVTEASCQTCHGNQDYKVGDIQGGMSVSVPLAPLMALGQREFAILVIIDGVIWVLGLGVIGFGARQTQARGRELARAEALLQHAERKYQGIFDQANEGLLIMTLDGIVSEFNRAFAEMHGYQVDELKNTDIRALDVLHERALEDRTDIVRRVQAGEVVRFEVQHHHKDGHIIPLSVTTSIINLGGQPFYLAYHQDITARKQAAETLRASDEMLSLFLQHSPVYAYIKEVTATESRVLRASDNFHQMIGISGRDMTGKTMAELFPPELAAKITADDWAVVSTGEVLQAEESLNGRSYTTIKFPLVQGEKSMLAGYTIDITARKQAEAQTHLLLAELNESRQVLLGVIEDQKAAELEQERLLTRAEVSRRSLLSTLEDQKRAEAEIRELNIGLEHRVAERTAELTASNAELEAFSYSVSHDLRAPLRSIDGFSRILLDDYTATLDDEGRDSLNRIRAGTQRMGQLIDGLLKLSRVTRTELLHRQVDLSAMARDVAAELQEHAPDRRATLVVADGIVADGDPSLLRVVLTNLLGNAWKFTGARADARIEFGTTQLDGKTIYFVRDNGAGFDANYAGKLFGAFQRLHSSAEFPGTGIGLATTRRIVNRHGGRVWAEGAVDKGATFYFVLPSQA